MIKTTLTLTAAAALSLSSLSACASDPLNQPNNPFRNTPRAQQQAPFHGQNAPVRGPRAEGQQNTTKRPGYGYGQVTGYSCVQQQQALQNERRALEQEAQDLNHGFGKVMENNHMSVNASNERMQDYRQRLRSWELRWQDHTWRCGNTTRW